MQTIKRINEILKRVGHSIEVISPNEIVIVNKNGEVVKRLTKETRITPQEIKKQVKDFFLKKEKTNLTYDLKGESLGEENKELLKLIAPIENYLFTIKTELSVKRLKEGQYEKIKATLEKMKETINW